MQKLLLGTAVVALGVIAVAGPAKADGLKLDLAGHFKGYVSWIDQDEADDDAGTAADESEDVRDLDILRETEIHFTGETTLDNGLTVGFHTEADIDDADEFDTEESYAYFSGAWGRMNFGMEDGAAYLLQVAAPSADSNVDGLRQYVSGTNYDVLTNDGTAVDFTLADLFGAGIAAGEVLVDADGNGAASVGDALVGAGFASVADGDLFAFDYDQAISGTANKLTYLTPVFNGFQMGASYTPEVDGSEDFGNSDDDTFGEYGDVFDIAARFEGQLGEVGMTLGAGYSHSEAEAEGAPVFFREDNGVAGFQDGTDTVLASIDDREAWNLGADFNWGAFGFGAAYVEDDLGVSSDVFERETWVVGADYTTGPFKLGASYYDQDVGDAVESDRWTAGLVYTYGPGMTFRGSVAFLDHEESLGASESADSTNLLFGTQIDF